MTIQDRILDYLQKHPEGIDDDALTIALSLAQRQQANQRCRRLEQFGFITRRRVDGKIRNFFNSAGTVLDGFLRNSTHAFFGLIVTAK